MYKDDDGWTALHMAVMNGNNRALEMLLDQPGADINVATNEGRTLVHQAAKSGRTETLKLLVERGARVDVTNAAGATPLDLAIKEGRSNAAEYLRSLEQPAH
jgi:26S proteasome non-ATPase regulatory subunit 10